MTKALGLLVAAGLLALSAAVTSAGAEEPQSCKVVRFSDVGWTDITATTATTAAILKAIGYTPRITILSVPVTFQSLRNKDVDVFLGNWMPAQKKAVDALLADHGAEVVRANLDGAKYTLAVPSYTYDAGLHDFADIHKFADALHDRMYGIEPGALGNQHLLTLINTGQFGLGHFKLVESSEQGMLSEVTRAVRGKKPIVFLGWEPHPMNTEFAIKYLTGGDAAFGPNYGGATVYTLTRDGYGQQCPNVYKLLQNEQFTLAMEDGWMSDILLNHQEPGTVATRWLKAHPSVAQAWLTGVTTFDGKPAAPALATAFGQ